MHEKSGILALTAQLKWTLIRHKTCASDTATGGSVIENVYNEMSNYE